MGHTKYSVERGKPHPLGARVTEEGVNFSVFSSHATRVELLIFDQHDDREPVQEISLDPVKNKSFVFWHCHVKGLRAGAHYAYRVDGPWEPHNGHRFNRNKVLLDPYALGNTNTLWQRGDACGGEDNLGTSMRSVVVDTDDYDWEGDRPLDRPLSESVIYEMNVTGFTKSPTSNVSAPGTFRGVIDKIPYLTQLGITAVELLPVFEFDDKEVLRQLPDGTALNNFWGYSTLGFFAPDSKFCVTPEAGSHVKEFRDMVKALHQAGIEVILDVVFNHTNEGNHEGPTISFKGLDNSVYYHLVEQDKQFCFDYSGCGNTVNCNHPIVEKFILDCLRYWVREMHVDGFRFDEGSILSRGEDGRPLRHAPILWAIELDEELATAKLIAEAWDAAGLYQVGSFPGYRWAEWNGRFRDDVRRFVAGREGLVGSIATRVGGSADLFQEHGRLPINSVNFVTCHDGFTLNDLVSYNWKHNEANGEGNNDGVNDNDSWNCGHEGPSDDPNLEAFRSRQVKNFAAVMLLSQGVPMILGGDEMRRTQQGNNNAYCQDNEISWYDWNLWEKNLDVFRFFEKMIAFRKRHRSLQRDSYFNGETNERGLADISWHGCRLNNPGWNDPMSRVLAFTLGGFNGEEDVHVLFNMSEDNLDFEIPELANRRWYECVDTAKSSPEDIVEAGKERAVNGAVVEVTGRSVKVLISR
jgi:glycogen operon protein